MRIQVEEDIVDALTPVVEGGHAIISYLLDSLSKFSVIKGLKRTWLTE